MIRLILFCILLLPILNTCNESTETPTKGSVTVYTDESVLPLIIKEKDAFTSIYNETAVKVIPVKTSEGIEKLLKDDIVMFISSRNFTSSEQTIINNRRLDIKTYDFCYGGIAVLTSRQNSLTKISFDDIKDLLTGKSSKLKIYLPSEKTGIYEFIKGEFLDGKPPAGAVLLDGDKEIKEALKNQPQSIGLTGFNQVKDTNSLRIMPVGVLNYLTKQIDYFIPHPAYFINGQYPLTREIFIFLNDKHFGVASGFTSFLTSTEGQKVVLSENLAPGSVSVKIVSHK